MSIVLAWLMGVVSGMRAMTASAAVAWAAHLGWLGLEGTPLAWLGHVAAPWVLSVLALVEIVNDKLPKTPSRKVPLQLGARLVSGALVGAAIGAPGGMLVVGLVAGVVGALLGTYGGAAARGALARSFDRDLPAALVEDAVAILGAFLIASEL